MDPNVEKINDELSTRFGYEFITENFNTLLTETGALLAGGFVLSALNDEMDRYPDMDIYVQESQAEKVTNFFLEHGYNIVNLHMAPAYDQSFFRKNNIISRVALTKWTEPPLNPVDIMIIPDKIEPSNVVTNFDLTFCEIWYNGSEVKGTNVKDSLLKEGRLRKEYQEALLVYFNPFILKRIKKYLKRGYKISYKCDGKMNVKPRKKTVISAEAWIVTKIYEGIMKTRREKDNIFHGWHDPGRLHLTWILENPLIEPTYANLRKISENTGDIPKVIHELTTDSNLSKLRSFLDVSFKGEADKDLKIYYILLLSIMLPRSNQVITPQNKQNILPEIYIKYLSDFFGFNYKDWDFPYNDTKRSGLSLKKMKVRRAVITSDFEIGIAKPVIVDPNLKSKREENKKIRELLIKLTIFYSLPPVNLDTITVDEHNLGKDCEDILLRYTYDDDVDLTAKMDDNTKKRIELQKEIDTTLKEYQTMKPGKERTALRMTYLEKTRDKNKLRGLAGLLVHQKKKSVHNIKTHNKNNKNFILVLGKKEEKHVEGIVTEVNKDGIQLEYTIYDDGYYVPDVASSLLSGFTHEYKHTYITDDAHIYSVGQPIMVYYYPENPFDFTLTSRNVNRMANRGEEKEEEEKEEEKKEEEEEEDILCYDRNSLLERTAKWERWLIECYGNYGFLDIVHEKGVVDMDQMYVGIAIRQLGPEAYVDVRQVRALLLLLEENVHIFYLIFDRRIKYTVSLEFFRPESGDATSANHCQARSSIDVYNLKVCSGTECIPSSSDGIVEGSTDNYKLKYGDLLADELPRFRILRPPAPEPTRFVAPGIHDSDTTDDDEDEDEDEAEHLPPQDLDIPPDSDSTMVDSDDDDFSALRNIYLAREEDLERQEAQELGVAEYLPPQDQDIPPEDIPRHEDIPSEFGSDSEEIISDDSRYCQYLEAEECEATDLCLWDGTDCLVVP